MASSTYEMNHKLGFSSMFIATTCMGLSGFLTRGAVRTELFSNTLVAGSSLGAFMTVGRMVMGFALFALLVIALKKVGVLRSTSLSPSVVLGGLAVGIGLSFYQVSSLLTSIANSVFLIYTGPLFCTLLARIFRKEPIGKFHGICLVAVFCGMMLTSGIVSWDAGTGIVVGLDLSLSTPEFPDKGLGNLFGLISGIGYGTSLFFNGYRKDMDSVVRNVWNFLFAAVGSLAVALCMTVVWPVGGLSAMQPANWAWAAALWVVCGPIGLGLVLVGGRNLPAVEYATVGYWECVVACVIGAIVFQEAWTLATVLGGVLIIGGGAAPVIASLVRKE